MVIYIPTEKYKYMVIIESDTILHEYYITRKYKSISYEEIYKSREVPTSSKRGLENQTREELEGRVTVTFKLRLRSDHHGRIRCAF